MDSSVLLVSIDSTWQNRTVTKQNYYKTEQWKERTVIKQNSAKNNCDTTEQWQNRIETKENYDKKEQWQNRTLNKSEYRNEQTTNLT